MRYSYLLGLAALAAASDVHDLHKDDFSDFVGQHDLALIECMRRCCLYPFQWCHELTQQHSLCAVVRALQGSRP